MENVDALTIIKDLFAKYGITTRDTAHEIIRERFTQDDLDAYYAAKDALMGQGAI